ncbi:MAG: CHASE2 domain-containing protein [Desulfonatronovibrio sp.]
MFASTGPFLARTIRKARSLKGVLVVTGLGFTLLMAGLFIFQPVFISILEHKVFDALFRSSYSAKHPDNIIIVDLDEESLAEFGQWPWPRYRVALMLEKIRRAGAVSIGLDMVFAEQDRTSPRIIKEQLQQELGVSIDFAGLPQGLEDNDIILANILANGPFVLGYYFNLHQSGSDQVSPIDENFLHPLQLAIVSTPSAVPLDQALFNARGMTANIETLSSAARGSGFMNVAPDADGVIRRVPLLMAHDEKYYPSLALAVMLNLFDSRQVAAKATSGGLESIRLAGQIIPVDSKGQLLLNYRGPSGTFKYISAADVLKDQVDPNIFQGKIVFVGTSAAGLKDIRTTPLDTVYPGVEAQATVAENILTGDFIFQPDWTLGLEFILIILAGLVSTAFIIWLGGLWLILLLVVGAAGMWFGAIHILQEYGLHISPMMPLVTLAGNFSLLTFEKFWLEEKEKRKIRNTFEHYLSPDVIRRVIKNPDLLKLGGEKKNLTILFSDIRSFTSISESMSPPELVKFMNEYLTAMTDVVLKNHGTLDKYMGDAIMAFFGAPEDMPDHAVTAQKTAIEMLERLYECRENWCFPGIDRVEIGVGLSSGEVIVGNMGSENRFDYTVMGDQVNLASRLEGLTKEYGVKILVSEFTRQQSGEELAYREIDLVRVKGKQKPVAVYEPLGKDYFTGGEFAFIPPFEKGLTAYRNQNWDQAVELFNAVLEIKPEDKPALIYIDRCRKMAQSPPGEGWDGVWIMTTK